MPKLRVLHLSDIHIDRQYAEGSEADCETPSEWDLFVLCCRNYPPTRAQTEKGEYAASMIKSSKYIHKLFTGVKIKDAFLRGS